ncbi:hypothetical protein [Candidatus Pantoea formicae]|uniref:hypothetical protein n=1 Tax=Candidatus Pantoea formicae TaxID=2608355 RepID=UPI003ED85580
MLVLSEPIYMQVQVKFRFLVPAVRSSLRCGTPQQELAASVLFLFVNLGRKMTTLNDVYCKFGEASEAAQLIEVELVNVAISHALNSGISVQEVKRDFTVIDSFTIERLMKRLKNLGILNDKNCEPIELARKARNDLSHNFYRRHGFKRFSSEGCKDMLENLMELHWVIFEGYRQVLLLSNVELPSLAEENEEYRKFVNS